MVKTVDFVMCILPQLNIILKYIKTNEQQEEILKLLGLVKSAAIYFPFSLKHLVCVWLRD